MTATKTKSRGRKAGARRRRKGPIPFEDTKCGGCIALCCRYFAMEIDKPTEPDDFEDLRWYMLHEKVEIFVEDRAWYVQIYNKCSALGADNRCTIYETRPKICREYSDDFCDKDEQEGSPSASELSFRTLAELEAYRDKWVKRYEARKRRERSEAARRGAATRRRRALAAARG